MADIEKVVSTISKDYDEFAWKEAKNRLTETEMEAYEFASNASRQLYLRGYLPIGKLVADYKRDKKSRERRESCLTGSYPNCR